MATPSFRAVLFDFDGTLTRPDALDFAAVRNAMGCPLTSPILEFIESLATEEERGKARRILDEFEQKAARASVPNHGAEEVILLLRKKGIDRGIITRNSMASIREALKNFPTLSEMDFSVILTRESAGRPKPHPDGVLEAARLFGVPPEEMLVVGDFIFDIAAGKAAGAAAALITNGHDAAESWRGHIQTPLLAAPDFTISSLIELKGILGL